MPTGRAEDPPSKLHIGKYAVTLRVAGGWDVSCETVRAAGWYTSRQAYRHHAFTGGSAVDIGWVQAAIGIATHVVVLGVARYPEEELGQRARDLRSGRQFSGALEPLAAHQGGDRSSITQILGPCPIGENGQYIALANIGGGDVVLPCRSCGR